MKYTLTKKVPKKALAELFLMLSDSIDENVPDIIWEGLEFEVDLKQSEINCEIKYGSSKQGGEFSIKVGWITPAAVKEKEKEKAKETKKKLEKIEKGKESKKTATSKAKSVDEDEELWLEEEEDWGFTSSDGEWDNEDYDDEW
jgi:hypothetical protein